jgi:hypothetical protein
VKFYKTLNAQFVGNSDAIDTSKINYSLSIPKLNKLQEDLLGRAFKLESTKPVEKVLQEYNELIIYRWDHFRDKVSYPEELQLCQFPWELVYETVRKDFFPNRQKRSESYFVFNELRDAENWARRRPDYVVCEVLVENLVSSFTGDMYYLDCVEIDSTFEIIVESVKKYWSGDISNTPTIETLLQGNLVLSRIDKHLP